MTHKIAILGASGYTGAELVRLIATHPSMQIVALSADRKAGLEMAEVFPHLRHLALPKLVTIDAIDFSQVDLCFCALPHATSQAVIKQLPKTLKIVDLSADFRLRDAEVYAATYGGKHQAPELQAEAVYGLTEFYRDDITIERKLDMRSVHISHDPLDEVDLSLFADYEQIGVGLCLQDLLPLVRERITLIFKPHMPNLPARNT